MGRKLLSFLGVTKYMEVSHYLSKEEPAPPSPFIQESLVDLLCKDWGKNDSVVVFLTEDARRKNWLSKEEYEEANFDKGLKERLTSKLEPRGVRVLEVQIPEGRNEKELWEIFDKIVGVIENRDTIILDITHGYRSLPLLILIALNYACILKNAKIEKIVYGALEAAGSPEELRKLPPEERLVPIFDLTPFIDLFGWAIAVSKFLDTGDAEPLKQLAYEKLKPLLARTRGKLGGSLRVLIENLSELSLNILTCRAPHLRDSVSRIKSILPEAKKELEQVKEVRPLVPLFRKIEEKINIFDLSNDISIGLSAVKWCIKHGLIQQGLTVLRELIVNYVIHEILEREMIAPINDPKVRKFAEDLLNTSSRLVINKVMTAGKIPKDLAKLWGEIRQYRNDINHAGWRPDSRKSLDFKNKLQEFLKRFEHFIEKNFGMQENKNPSFCHHTF
ncbi:MAG: TIGR02221 family CRISPR-associated protein [Candidatus Baldrarchaeia archaeon]